MGDIVFGGGASVGISECGAGGDPAVAVLGWWCGVVVVDVGIKDCGIDQ